MKVHAPDQSVSEHPVRLGEDIERARSDHVERRLHYQPRELSLTVKQVALRVGVGFQPIHRYETGSSLSAARLPATADALDVSPLFFLDDDEPLQTAGPIEFALTSSGAR
jgi:transcriptional regulator with XRE-family HTH domain